METKPYRDTLIPGLIIIIVIVLLFNAFSGRSALREATIKIKEAQSDLRAVKDSLEKSRAEIAGIIDKMNTSEIDLNLIKNRVQIIDFNYLLTKARSVSDIADIKEKISREETEREQLIKQLEKFK